MTKVFCSTTWCANHVDGRCKLSEIRVKQTGAYMECFNYKESSAHKFAMRFLGGNVRCSSQKAEGV